MKLQLSMRARLWLAAALPAVLAVAALLYVVLARYTSELTHAWQERARVAALQLAGAAEFPLFAGDLETLQRLVDATHKGDAQLRAAALYNPAGERVVSAGAHDGDLPPMDGQEHVLLDRHLTVVLPMIQFSGTPGGDLFQETSGAAATGRPLLVRGHVVIQLSLDDLRQRRNELLLWVGLATGAALLLAALLSTAIASSVTRPIRHISLVVRRIGAGAISARADAEHCGALSELAHGVNDMARRVGMTQEELRTQVEIATAELRRQKEAAEQAARLDPLTQVLGRRGFTEHADNEIQRCLRYRHTLSLVMIDIDHFKVINDTHGHAAGDAVLVNFARLLSSELREWDVVGRLGGEEFAVLLPSSTAEQAMGVAERMRERVASTEIRLRGQPLAFTASFGVAEFEPDELTLDSLLARADAALYTAKRGGRNRVVLAGATGAMPLSPPDQTAG